MGFYNFISENCILPFNDLVSKQSVYRNLRFLNRSQYWTKVQIRTYQFERLKQLISHSSKYVPYYRNLFIELGLSSKDFQSIEDLKKIPILKKSTFYKEGIESFTSTDYPAKLRILNGSSGSTGEPLFYYETKDSHSMNLAANLRGWYWMDYRLGDKFIKLSQNPRKSINKKLQDIISRNLYLSTNPLVESNFEFILNKIQRYRPKIIRCYPDPLLFLARYKKVNLKFNFKPQAITTTGNILHPEIREEIESAFDCKVFDSYSCEGNPVVFECPTHTCYHSTEEYGITEIIDDSGKNIEKGIGKLISTDLWNLAHPFIRYDTQDLVEIDDEPCNCGRKHLKILQIIGRDNEVLEMKNGRKFIVHNFTGFFQIDHSEINRSVEQFQVVKKNSLVIFKLVVNKRFSETVSAFIKNYWEKELGTHVSVELVESIPLSRNGKRRFILIDK